MRRTLILKLGDKSYELTTDASEEFVLAVINRIQNQFTQIKNSSTEASLDEILVVMLANSVLNEIKYEETLEKITNKIKALFDQKKR
ncbi:cell division protein ZapA [Pseudothermotoga sp.]|nr:cell division protein ZapA [Pseudothermotoga sp.]MCX7812265.1 cell division protein ZapA [Pseudothermotoga sp.]MDW8139335.1 cell division protein ZapA [Pseudothermotoga sp.]